MGKCKCIIDRGTIANGASEREEKIERSYWKLEISFLINSEFSFSSASVFVSSSVFPAQYPSEFGVDTFTLCISGLQENLSPLTLSVGFSCKIGKKIAGKCVEKQAMCRACFNSRRY